LLGATRKLKMASEEEIARELPTLEVGGVPPFGPMVPFAEVIDRASLGQQRVLCAAANHHHPCALYTRPMEKPRRSGAFP
jgi:prolyl-tRNA editing enzyme YbaK/EbsC (Cys-tRNA(Pro) deacylase)